MRIFIVGGGPSLVDFDWSFLHNRYIIAVNRAYSKLPNADFIYFSDIRFWNWFGKDLSQHSGRIITTAKLNPRPDNVMFYKASRERGRALDLTPGFLKLGNNSGYAAINLAVQLGATEIVLLGFDMHNTGGAAHWHSGYPVHNSDNVHSKSMIKYFTPLAVELRALGIKIGNYGMTSKLTVFDKHELSAVYDL